MAVYLLHFDEPYKHARHYLGYADEVDLRLNAHRQNKGARLLQVVNGAGISWRLARTWPDGDRDLEKKLKRCKHGPRFCPICKGN